MTQIATKLAKFYTIMGITYEKVSQETCSGLFENKNTHYLESYDRPRLVSKVRCSTFVFCLIVSLVKKNVSNTLPEQITQNTQS